MEAVSVLRPDVEVHGIIGAAENMPDARAYRPSDVLMSLSGKGVEVVNTDAEGRMVLADALTYAARLSPDFIVDAATLTGATLISLGSPFSAFYTGSEPMAEAMKKAAADAGVSFWQMPLIEELVSQLKSDITDLKHTGDRFGGAITAALLLREFTEGVPWMHCDIPGAVFRERAQGMHPKGATGHAVLTFLELIEMHGRKAIVHGKKSSAVDKPPTSRTRKKPSVKPRSSTKKRAS
jgi:leucyl aminopeptidase